MTKTIKESTNVFKEYGKRLKQNKENNITTTLDCSNVEAIKDFLISFSSVFKSVLVSNDGHIKHPLLEYRLRNGVYCYFLKHPSILSKCLELYTYPLLEIVRLYDISDKYSIKISCKVILYTSKTDLEFFFKDLKEFKETQYPCYVEDFSLSTLQVKGLNFINIPENLQIHFELLIAESLQHLIRHQKYFYLNLSLTSKESLINQMIMLRLNNVKDLEIYLSTIPINTFLVFTQEKLQYLRL